MSSNQHTKGGPIFMKIGGKYRNMTTEPFEEDQPEFPHYGEFKRQIEQLINTKTQSNIFRPEPHNKEIGTSTEEETLTQRFLRIDAYGDPDNTQPPCTSEDTKNYHNMVRAKAKQALADTIACDLYISVLGKHRKAQMQTLIDDTNTPARTRLTKIKEAHWREVTDHIQIIIANYKQQWYQGYVRAKDLRSAMDNLNILQEINRQVSNFNPKQTYSGLDIITLMLPTLTACEFNQMVRDWKKDIRRGITPSLTEIADDIQSCFSIQNSVTNPDTYSFIKASNDTQQARANNSYIHDEHRSRHDTTPHSSQKYYSDIDIRNIRTEAFREGRASTQHTVQKERSHTRSESQPQKQQYGNSKSRETTRDTRSRSKSETPRHQQSHTTKDNRSPYTDRSRSRSREQPPPRQKPNQNSKDNHPPYKRPPSPNNKD